LPKLLSSQTKVYNQTIISMQSTRLTF